MQDFADGIIHGLNVLKTIVTNKIFYITFTSWFVAQSIKVLLHLVVRRRFDFRLFVGTGGMPSSHTAAVTAATVVIGMHSGWESPVFMVCLCYCLVVISDAMGVRRAAGRQAVVLNKMIDEIGHHKFNSERLKELLGHTPTEAAAGIILGIIVPIIMF